MTDLAADVETLYCPLCEYNLRGLTDPRCPECGYSFQWEELRDPSRRLHPFLFEHHPERSIWSFVQTFRSGFRSSAFWKSIYPTQRLNVMRMLKYWAVVAAVCMLPVLLQATFSLIQADQYIQSRRVSALRAITPQQKPKIIAKYGSLEAFLAQEFPRFPSRWSINLATNYYDFRHVLLTGGFLIFWPLATFAALMVFQISMRRAKIRPAHVLRCVVYTSDAAIVGASVVLLIAIAEQYVSPGSYSTISQYLPTFLALWMVLLTHRLWNSYRFYLRFNHALATVLASQAMVLLLLIKFALDFSLIHM